MVSNCIKGIKGTLRFWTILALFGIGTDADAGPATITDGTDVMQAATSTPSSTATASFDDLGAGLPGLSGSSAAWGDYDGDGDLDILLAGYLPGPTPITRVYRNDAGTFSDIAAGLPGVGSSSVAWGDYDRDGDLDILISGAIPVGGLLRVYRNDAGVFTSIPAGLPPLTSSSVAWGDADNDGDLDLLIAGDWDGTSYSEIFRNDAGVFDFMSSGLSNHGQGPAVAWGDYDRDGDLDILIAGGTPLGLRASVFANDGGSFSNINAGLTPVFNCAAAWGDYDNDGDLDILLAGTASGNATIARVYRNDAGAFQDVAAGLPGVASPSVAWGDCDNDGDLDILLTGITVDSGLVTRVYRNTGGAFSDMGAGLPGVFDGSGTWGDYDNDGDLDILLMGNTGGGVYISRVYKNTGAPANQPPAAPGGLEAAWSGSSVTFNWTAATDAETPSAGLHYNLRVGTTPGGSEISAAMADAGGYRRVPALGNANEGLSWTLEAPTQPLYWSVQAVDAAFAGSPFAAEAIVIPPMNDIGAGLAGVDSAAVAWGDYDGDGDLDIALAGWTGSAWLSRIYRNDAGTWTDIGAGLINVAWGSVAWGDYDNDGDLDLLLTGGSLFADIARVYRNDAGTFFNIGGLQGVAQSAAAWGDYDNDGDLDILLTGVTGSTRIARVYRNNAGAFADIAAGLPGVQNSSVAWGDYDNDGDLDIALSGFTGSTFIARIYRNDDGTFADIAAGLPGVRFSSMAWGDYDADGDLDLLLTGYLVFGGIALVYRNDGGAFTNINAGLPGVYYSSGAWGDYDNDGLLDILITGDTQSGSIARVYVNRGGAFVDIGAGLPGVAYSAAAWGDYDNDGALDVLLAGKSDAPITGIYRNNSPNLNASPAAPTPLAAEWNGDRVTFSWAPASDDATLPSGLGYNLRVGITPGGCEITSAMADGATGYRRVPALGNTNQDLSWTVTVNPPQTLYWSVQAVDAALAGSPFATEIISDPATSAVGDSELPPPAILLHANSPNPFRVRTRVDFDLPAAGGVTIQVFDVSGHLVRTLVDAPLPAGSHTVYWNGMDDTGRSVGQGVFLYRLTSGSFRTARRMVVVR